MRSLLVTSALCIMLLLLAGRNAVSQSVGSSSAGKKAVGAPFGFPPMPEDPLLAKVAPDECLWYVSWAGSAEPKANSKNHLEALLADEEIQRLMRVVEAAITQAILKKTGRTPQAAVRARESAALVKAFLTRPMAAFVSEAKFEKRQAIVKGGLIIHTGKKTADLKKSLGLVFSATSDDKKTQEAKIGGGTWKQIPAKGPMPQVTFGFRGDYFILGVGTGSVEGILKRAQTPKPQWLVDLHKKLAVERVSMVSYLNLKAIENLVVESKMLGSELELIIKALDLDKINSMACITGLEGPDCVSRAMLATEGNLGGLFSILGDKPLAAKDLKPIPKDAVFAAAARVDAKKMFLAWLVTMGKVIPREQEQLIKEMEQAQEALGFQIADDLLGPLGDVWCIYDSPSEGGLLGTGLTMTVGVNDHKRLAATIDKLMLLAKAQDVTSKLRGQPRRRRDVTIHSLQFKGNKIYYATFQSLGFIDFIPFFVPAWCLTEKELIVSLFPQHIKSYLSRDPSADSLADVPAVARLFQGGAAPNKLVYHDTKKIFETVYPILKILAQAASHELRREGFAIDVSVLPSATAVSKHLLPGTISVRKTGDGFLVESRNSIPGDGGFSALAPAMVGVGIPAVLSAQQAAKRNAAARSLRQVASAMFTYEAIHGTLPASTNKGLSWRVHLLPYCVERDLYNQFKLDEPWDSENNKKLIASMPPIYRMPGSMVAAQGMTRLVLPTGEQAVFNGEKKTKIADITDGISKTIMIVAVGDESAVVWTKPDDLPFDPKQPLRGIRGHRQGTFNVAFCDGAVRSIQGNINPDVFAALVTSKGNDNEKLREFFGGPVRRPRGAGLILETTSPEEFKEVYGEEVYEEVFGDTGTKAASPRGKTSSRRFEKTGKLPARTKNKRVSKTPKRVEAKPGISGRVEGVGDGVHATPVKALWRMEETIQLNIQRKKAEQFYKASHDGKGPKTHDEYMKEIIEKSSIKLPKLPPGQSYAYDPKTEKLMVEKPQ